LLHLSGWPKVEKVLRAIDIVEELGIDSANAAPAHWRHVQNRLFVNENLGNTRSPDIGLGFSAGTSTGDPCPGKADHDGERDGCPPDHDGVEADAARGLERIRERAGRAVSSAHEADGKDLVIAMPPEPLATFLARAAIYRAGCHLSNTS
jgi:hypothetical protein